MKAVSNGSPQCSRAVPLLSQRAYNTQHQRAYNAPTKLNALSSPGHDSGIARA
jgi:hypothetical protein